MTANIDSQTVSYEDALLRIVRSLPPERVSEIVDFARFIQLMVVAGDHTLDEDETEEEIRSDEERWDRLLARPEAQRLLVEMADEALEEYRAGRTTGIGTTEDGLLTPA